MNMNMNMSTHVLKGELVVRSDPEEKGNNTQSYGSCIAFSHRFSAKHRTLWDKLIRTKEDKNVHGDMAFLENPLCQ